MSVEQEILVEIRRLRQRLPGVSGCLAATLDGLLIAGDVDRRNPDTLAALAATGLALGQRVCATAGYGELTETVVTALGGHVAVYAAGSRALLAVLASDRVDLPVLHVEARQVAGRVAAVIEVLDVVSGMDGLDDRPSPSGGWPAPPAAQARREPWPGGEPLPRRIPAPRRAAVPRRGDGAPPREPDIRFTEDPVAPMPRRTPPIWR